MGSLSMTRIFSSAAFLLLTAGPLRASTGTDHPPCGDAKQTPEATRLLSAQQGPTASRQWSWRRSGNRKVSLGAWPELRCCPSPSPVRSSRDDSNCRASVIANHPPHPRPPPSAHQSSAIRRLLSLAEDYTQATAPATPSRSHGLRQHQKAGVEPDPVRYQGRRAEDAEW